MDKLRTSDNAADKMRCNDTMYELKPKIERLIQRGENFPRTSAFMSARIAAGNLQLCATCSQSIAPKYCEQVEQEIQKAIKYSKEE